jgi:hypothetical protein
MAITYPTIPQDEIILLPTLTTLDFENPIVVSGTSPSFVTTVFIPPAKYANLADGRYEIYAIANVTGSSANITGSVAFPGVFSIEFPYKDTFSAGFSMLSARKAGGGFTIGYDSNDLSEYTPTYLGFSFPLYASGSSSDVTSSIYQVYMLKQS